MFPGFTPDLAKKTMARACVTAGIAHRHPHDLRHRYERSTQLRDVLKQRQTPPNERCEDSVADDTFSNANIHH